MDLFSWVSGRNRAGALPRGKQAQGHKPPQAQRRWALTQFLRPKLNPSVTKRQLGHPQQLALDVSRTGLSATNGLARYKGPSYNTSYGDGRPPTTGMSSNYQPRWIDHPYQKKRTPAADLVLESSHHEGFPQQYPPPDVRTQEAPSSLSVDYNEWSTDSYYTGRSTPSIRSGPSGPYLGPFAKPLTSNSGRVPRRRAPSPSGTMGSYQSLVNIDTKPLPLVPGSRSSQVPMASGSGSLGGPRGGSVRSNQSSFYEPEPKPRQPVPLPQIPESAILTLGESVFGVDPETLQQEIHQRAAKKAEKELGVESWTGMRRGRDGRLEEHIVQTVDEGRLRRYHRERMNRDKWEEIQPSIEEDVRQRGLRPIGSNKTDDHRAGHHQDWPLSSLAPGERAVKPRASSARPHDRATGWEEEVRDPRLRKLSTAKDGREQEQQPRRQKDEERRAREYMKKRRENFKATVRIPATNKRTWSEEGSSEEYSGPGEPHEMNDYNPVGGYYSEHQPDYYNNPNWPLQ